jgi:nitroimidazol reductase NimA-like FMN-containing flavoprotein (pyridoxamine 5'-phosphate oxidase superfamily)
MKTYPQKPSFTQKELEAFLKEAPIARLCSHNSDGTIHIAPVYFKYEGGEIIIGTQDVSRKVKNIKRNPKVTVLIDNQTPPWKGVIIYGEAKLEYTDVIEKRSLIFERYMKPEIAQKTTLDLANTFAPVVIRVIPERIVSYDYSKLGFKEISSASIKV